MDAYAAEVNPERFVHLGKDLGWELTALAGLSFDLIRDLRRRRGLFFLDRFFLFILLGIDRILVRRFFLGGFFFGIPLERFPFLLDSGAPLTRLGLFLFLLFVFSL